MVIVGGATRLTDSGLSITEWKPILGALPPLGQADWLEAFEKYKQIPEYQVVNRGMQLDEFKFIFWWEWSHRFLGRFIGLAFFLPMLAFWLTGRLESRLRAPLAGLFVLGGLQGLMGWYMVMSGLAERVDVSQYRLAAHLTLAAFILAGLIWVMLDIGQRRASRIKFGPLALVALIVLQIFAGALVAGLDAGLTYNTWPLMDGDFIPDGLFSETPGWRNLFENILTVQFQHRMLAYLVLIAVIDEARKSIRRGPEAAKNPAWVMVAIVIVQVVLGIATLLAVVPLSLALMHQAGAFLLLAAAIWHLHSSAAPERRASPGA
ncbi:MAG: COX15/CtaA family protein [Rhizobiales bacterium]|nr:COX15/CtaA family protein [Hyphomicrobiales bacterium]